MRNKIFKKIKKITKIFRKVKPSQSPTKRFVPLVKMFLGKPLFIHDIASFYLGEAELFKSEMYKFKAKCKNPFIIDCGSNLGMSIIYFKELYPEASIVAFEADEYIFGFLEKNMRSFEYENVQLINKAVWNCEDTLSFLVEGGAGGRLEMEKTTGTYKKVNCTGLKKYLVGRKVDFLKIDIEGSEYKVIKDCENELNNIDYIFIEYHSFANQEQNLHKILDIVSKAGFKYHIKEACTRKNPFIDKNLNLGMDLQLNIFCNRI
jgi:FkbM family methyltransferase